MYRREVWEKVGPYDAEMWLCEDWDYWLRCLQATPMAVLHKTLYAYRMHGDSLTAQQRARQFVAGEKVLRKHLPHLARASRHLRAQGWLWVVGVARRRRDFKGALEGFWRALVLAPALTIATVFKVLGTGLKSPRFIWHLRNWSVDWRCVGCLHPVWQAAPHRITWYRDNVLRLSLTFVLEGGTGTAAAGSRFDYACQVAPMRMTGLIAG